jgi:antitoxin (DNA-binding transcriptional repressor) of toxin-antitoxin stability system
VTKSSDPIVEPRARFGVHEAKTHLSKLLQRVSTGESIDIERRGVVVATLVPPESEHRREFGTDAGRIWISDDFDAPLPDDLLATFES